MNKKIKVVILGYGNRGQIYSKYANIHPSEMEIVAVIDPNPIKLDIAKKNHKLTNNQLFKDWVSFLKENIEADLVINATIDKYHYETTINVLKAKYNLLVEKPIVNNKKQLLEIKKLADKNKCKVFVCHVLRYTPFYSTIKKLINDNKIGEISSIEMNEHVWIPHYVSSYDRGKYGNENECGSPMLLAKCSHDLDLIAWFNEPNRAVKIASFGSKQQFSINKKPKEATKYCYNCPLEKKCLFSAINLYYKHNYFPFLTWTKINKPADKITDEDKLNLLKTDIYGRCAYDCGANVVDRQNLIIEFDNGSICSFSMIGGTSKPDRYIHIVGDKGEIEGKLESHKITLREYQNISWKEKIIDVSNQVYNYKKYASHAGGDYMIMHDIIKYLNNSKVTLSLTTLDKSVISHLLVYQAEKSRTTNKIVLINKDFFNN